jgi:hypothetical protein
MTARNSTTARIDFKNMFTSPSTGSFQTAVYLDNRKVGWAANAGHGTKTIITWSNDKARGKAKTLVTAAIVDSLVKLHRNRGTDLKWQRFVAGWHKINRHIVVFSDGQVFAVCAKGYDQWVAKNTRNNGRRIVDVIRVGTAV